MGTKSIVPLFTSWTWKMWPIVLSLISPADFVSLPLITELDATIGTAWKVAVSKGVGEIAYDQAYCFVEEESFSTRAKQSLTATLLYAVFRAQAAFSCEGAEIKCNLVQTCISIATNGFLK